MQSGVEANDAYVAATARAYSKAVLTRNTDDFERLGSRSKCTDVAIS
jgi:predicted nucleic acid-binding protein